MSFFIAISNGKLSWVFAAQLHAESWCFWCCPLTDQTAGLNKCMLFFFNYFLIPCIMVPNRAIASNIREESSACLICVSGKTEASGCNFPLLLWHTTCSLMLCGGHASHNHVCRENAHLQTNQHLNAIVLPVQRATKYQENSLYIIPAVKSNLQCSWHQG